MKAIYLRDAREAKNLTQEQLEEASGVSQAVISKLEREGGGDPAFSTVAKLSAALGVDPRALRFGPAPREAKAS